MTFRNYRLSDMVAAICMPATLFLCFHVMTLSRDLPSDITMPSGTGNTLSASASASASSGFSKFTGDTLMIKSSPNVQLRSFNEVRILPPLNNSGNGREDLLLITPIARCGSTGMRNLLKLLKKKHNFAFIDEPPKKKNIVHIPKTQIQKDIAANISLIKDPSALFQSFAHIDFAKFGYPAPVYVSMVREPVERAVSWFYSVRAPFQLVERQYKFPDSKLPSRAFLKKDLESCLKDRRDMECRYRPGMEKLGHTLEFFCGHEPQCVIFGNYECLTKAKSYVENNFAVVGILEEWDKTLTVLEHYVPRFFKGATQLYYDKISGNKGKTNENFYKPRVESEAMEILRKNFTIEKEFYIFLQQRLDRQYRAILLDEKT